MHNTKENLKKLEAKITRTLRTRKRQGYVLAHGWVGNDDKRHCLLSIMAPKRPGSEHYRVTGAAVLGLTELQALALEAGFENYDTQRETNRPLYRLGRKICVKELGC